MKSWYREKTVLKWCLIAAVASGCSKKAANEDKSTESTTTETTEDGSDKPIVIAGQLALSGTSAELMLTEEAVSVADLSIYCVSFTLPPVAGTATVSSEGVFELTLEASNTSVGCFILKGEDVLGSIVFEDSSKKDLAGGSKSGDRLAFSGGKSDLGSIVFDLTTGKAVVDVTKIVSEKAKDNTKASAEAVDFTGNYTITASGLDLPTGYVGTCAKQDGPQTKDNECHGPSEGEKLFLKTVNGKRVDDGTPMHGLMLWQSEDLFNLCGGRLGFSYDHAKEQGFDLTASGVAEGEFTWDSSLVDGWKSATARTRNSQMKMEQVEFKGFPGTKQYFKQYRQFTCAPKQPCTDGTPIEEAGFQFNANTKESGCRDASGVPVQMNDWKGMKCQGEALTGDKMGLKKNTCSKTYEGKVVTCVNISGAFKANGESIPNAMTRFPSDYVILAKGPFCDKNSNNEMDDGEFPMWNGNSQSCESGVTLKPGDFCSAMSATDDAGKLAQMRCYLEASQGNGGGKDEETASCQREIRANWSAKTPGEFLGSSDGPVKARGQHIFELFDYDSATSGSLRGEEREFRGIQVGDNWTDCEVINVFSIALKKYEDSTDLLAEMVQSERNISTKPACIAEFGEGKTMKMLFKLVHD